eukprot:295288_1
MAVNFLSKSNSSEWCRTHTLNQSISLPKIEGKTDVTGVLMRTEDREPPERNLLTSIYYLLGGGGDAKPFMCWAWTTSDIMYFWHGGVTVKYHILDPITGGYECIYLGPNLADGNTMQISIKGGLYKCAELIDTNSIEDYGLLAEAVSPGFDYQDFGFVNEDQLSAVAPPDKLEYLKQFLKVTFSAYKTSGARIDVE